MPKSNLEQYKKDFYRKNNNENQAIAKDSSFLNSMNSLEVFKYLSLVVPLLITFLVYLNMLDNDFLNWDDDRYVTANSHLDLTLQNVKYYFTKPYFVMYIPLTMLSFMLDYAIAGIENPSVYHIHNLILHLADTTLVWIFVFSLFKSFNDKKRQLSYAFFAALFFGLHPLHVESVSWIAERKDVLYTFWFFISLIFYLKYIRQQRNLFFYLSILSFFISLLAKTQAVVIPVLMLLIDWFEGKLNLSKYNLVKLLDWRYLRKFKLILEKIPLFILSLIFGIIAIYASATNEPFAHGKYTKHRIAVNTNYSAFEKVVYASYSLTMYFAELLFPFKMSAIHPYPYDRGQMPLWFKSFLLFPFLFFAFILYLIKLKEKIPAFGLLFFFFSIMIMLHIKNFVISEHYAYVPSVGMAIFIFYYLEKVLKIRQLTLITWIFILLYFTVFAFLVIKRNNVFQNSLTFWNDIEKKYPQVIVTYFNRGNYYQKLGDKAINRGDYKQGYHFYKKALEDYNKAIELKTNYVGIYSNRGITLAKLGKYKQALDDFNTLINLDSNFTDAYANRGNVYSLLKEWNKAIEDYSRAIRKNPSFLNAYYNRGIAYAKMHKYNLSIADFNLLLKIKPNYVNAYLQRGIVYFRKSSLDSAIANLKYYLSLKPSAEAYYYLGLTLQQKGDTIESKKVFQILKQKFPQYKKQLFSMAQDFENEADRFGKKQLYDKALNIYHRILDIYGENENILLYLGIVEGKKGNYWAAIENFNKALKINPNNAELLTNRGYAYFLAGKIQKALEDLNMAIKYDSTQYVAYYNRAVIYESLNKYSAALKDLSKALYLQPKFVKAYIEKGRIFLKLKALNKACFNFNKAAILGSAQAKKYLKKFCQNERY